MSRETITESLGLSLAASRYGRDHEPQPLPRRSGRRAMGCSPLRASEPLRASGVGRAQLAAIPEVLSEAPTHAIETRILGRLDEARAEVQAGLALNPGFTLRRYRDGAQSDNPVFLKGRERMIENLRKAGAPEG